MVVGIYLTEVEFDKRNAEITAQCNADGLECEAYASKLLTNGTEYFLTIVDGYEKYFTADEINNAVEWVAPVIEQNEIEV